ncbi:MAG: hypothetical protein A2017_10100 [Lentisphaerae bacterium GWF2_44_16]|nr:MAG: hypothetical protein A2017_10100 [Lentisphaerae bacterium GWF2_44_16]
MEEKIYYKDDRVKVTDLRITCNHVTVPIEKIENVIVDFKVATMTVSVSLFMLVLLLIPLLCYFYGPYGCWGIILLIAGAFWLRMIYKTYTVLKISLGTRTLNILETSMPNREYIFKIEEALKAAVLDVSSGANMAV